MATLNSGLFSSGQVACFIFMAKGVGFKPAHGASG